MDTQTVQAEAPYDLVDSNLSLISSLHMQETRRLMKTEGLDQGPAMRKAAEAVGACCRPAVTGEQLLTWRGIHAGLVGREKAALQTQLPTPKAASRPKPKLDEWTIGIWVEGRRRFADAGGVESQIRQLCQSMAPGDCRWIVKRTKEEAQRYQSSFGNIAGDLGWRGIDKKPLFQTHVEPYEGSKWLLVVRRL